MDIISELKTFGRMKKIPVVDYGAIQSSFNTNNNIEEVFTSVQKRVHNGDANFSETENILNREVISN